MNVKERRKKKEKTKKRKDDDRGSYRQKSQRADTCEGKHVSSVCLTHTKRVTVYEHELIQLHQLYTSLINQLDSTRHLQAIRPDIYIYIYICPFWVHSLQALRGTRRTKEKVANKTQL